jgi:hypothetical protein
MSDDRANGDDQFEDEHDAHITRFLKFGPKAVWAVFFYASISAIAIAFLTAILPLPGALTVLQVIELLVKLAALSLLGAFLFAAARNGKLTIFGFVVLSSVILTADEVATFIVILLDKDPAGLALLNGSNSALSAQRIRSIKTSGNNAENEGEPSDVSAAIVADYRDFLRSRPNSEVLDVLYPEDLQNLIDLRVTQFQCESTQLQVNSVGIGDILAAFDNRGESFLIRFLKHDRLEQDMRDLRSLGLIEFVYDELGQATVTPWGEAVLGDCTATKIGELYFAPAPTDGSPDEGFPGGESSDNNLDDLIIECGHRNQLWQAATDTISETDNPDLTITEQPSLFYLNGQATGIFSYGIQENLGISNRYEWLDLETSSTPNEEYAIIAKGLMSNSGMDADPVLALFDGDGECVGDNDDSSSEDRQTLATRLGLSAIDVDIFFEGYSSLLLWKPVSNKTYHLGIRNYDTVVGQRANIWVIPLDVTPSP